MNSTPSIGRKLLLAVSIWPAVLALLAPLSEGDINGRLGFLLVIVALIEFLHGFRRAEWRDQKSAWGSASITLFVGLLMLSAPSFAGQAFQLILAGWFGIDVLRNLITAVRPSTAKPARQSALLALPGYIAIVFAILFLPDSLMRWTLAAATSARIVFTALNASQAKLISADTSAASISQDFGFDQSSPVAQVVDTITKEECSRQSIDRRWILSFLFTLLAIHIGRMGYDRTALGIVSPLFAVLGDAFAALLISFLIVIPLIAASNRLTRGIESVLWTWSIAPARSGKWFPRLVQSALTVRLRTAIRLRLARCSMLLAINRGLQTGLPAAAFIAATAPMWGMSWYFDTENWAAGIWNSWAAHRTDAWREAMVEAVLSESPDTPLAEQFQVRPQLSPESAAGSTESPQAEDFAFVVIGDPGEGDASQHILRSEYLRTVQRDDIRFVIISSDVVYPTGAMRHYETNFWLPFMGTDKPVYAIPGNHDWYDALEGFAATFFEPEAARLAMRARVDADQHLSSSTDRYIDSLIAQASQLRSNYRIPVQQQTAPFFQIQTDRFALFAIDTGVVRSLDPIQFQWLEQALQKSAGKSKLVILGHPFFAGGRDTSTDDDEFQKIRRLLEQHDVDIVMAGDTHDLEYYREDNGRIHFVNGGGGAYLSFGTSLDWPSTPVTADWSFYPRRDAVVTKIEQTSPWWKHPFWVWTRNFGGWPFSAEWLSAAFDVNTAPFYQSFLEIRVEYSTNQIRIIPHGIHGTLQTADLQFAPSATQSTEPSAPVEWRIPLREQ